MKLDRVKELARGEACQERRKALRLYSLQTSKVLNTLRAYDYAVAEWVRWADEHGVDWLDPTLDDARDYAAELATERANTTCSLRMAAIRNFYSIVRQAGLTRNGVFQDIAFEGPSQQRATYHKDELDRMWALADNVDRAVILLAKEHGLRQREMLALTWADVSHQHRIRTRHKAQPISKQLDEVIHALPRRSGYLLPYRSPERMRARFRRLCFKANVEYRGVDVLRRYAA